jgi:hypothetical protein
VHATAHGEIFGERQQTRKRASLPFNNFVRLWLLCAAFAAAPA